jgi:hypothetical protein
MMSGDSGLSSFDLAVHSMDSATLVALHNTLLMLSSWSSYMKTPGGIDT